MKKILIFTEYYLPGVKGGGPIQSIKNLVDNLVDDYDFYIITSDRDLQDTKAYDGIEYNKWVKVNKANVQYINKNNMKSNELIKIINSVEYDLIFLNSFFSYRFSILILFLNKYNKITKTSLLLAPRGEFSLGALKLKSFKKKIYIFITNMFKLYTDVNWLASAEEEKKDINRITSNNGNISVATDLTANYKDFNYNKKINKIKGKLKIVFISRIHPKKNLLYAINLLENIKGDVLFDIYGPIEDLEYWRKCEKSISNLNKNINVEYKGTINHSKVIETFEYYHIFLFPTLGENFGHVISEALIAGCPIIISDQTPWLNLEKIQVGFDINLKNHEMFIEKIQYFVDMNYDEYQKYSKNAYNFIKEYVSKSSGRQSMLLIFNKIIK